MAIYDVTYSPTSLPALGGSDWNVAYHALTKVANGYAGNNLIPRDARAIINFIVELVEEIELLEIKIDHIHKDYIDIDS